MKVKAINKSQFKDWPFTVDEGLLVMTKQDYLLIRSKGKDYALNGVAKSLASKLGFSDVDDIWKQDETGYISMGEVLETGKNMKQKGSAFSNRIKQMSYRK